MVANYWVRFAFSKTFLILSGESVLIYIKYMHHLFSLSISDVAPPLAGQSIIYKQLVSARNLFRLPLHKSNAQRARGLHVTQIFTTRPRPRQRAFFSPGTCIQTCITPRSWASIKKKKRENKMSREYTGGSTRSQVTL